MYVAVKGGERAIENSLGLLREERRGDTEIPELSTQQVSEQLGLAVARVMAEGSLYNPELAALAIKQAQGDMIEAIFLLRAYRTTLPRFGYSEPLDTGKMALRRRISSTFKDLPGGQLLGPSYDYTHRLLDFALIEQGDEDRQSNASPADAAEQAMPRVLELLDSEGLVEREDDPDPMGPVSDLTREPLTQPAERDMRLQSLTRADEGFLLSLGYSTQRGFGNTHPFAGEIRYGFLEVEFLPEELGFPVVVGEIELTECEMINQFKGNKHRPPQFTRGYGLAFGYSERKAMSMALVDRALRCRELNELPESPAQDEEFVLSHGDNVEASGFVQHLKLPHYVDFQSELELIRRLRAETVSQTAEPPDHD